MLLRVPDAESLDKGVGAPDGDKLTLAATVTLEEAAGEPLSLLLSVCGPVALALAVVDNKGDMEYDVLAVPECDEEAVPVWLDVPV